MTVQPDGKVLAVIVAGDPTWEYYVARFTDDGQPDAGFGAGGRVLLHKGYLQAMGSQDVGWHMAIQPYTDRVLVSYDFGIPLTAFDSDGRLDLAFGGDDLDGTVEWPVVYPGEDTRVTRWSVDGDGRLLGVGYVGAQPSDILLVRLTAEGVPDLTFGSAGVVTTGLAARTHDVGHICGQLADGGIFVYAQVQSDMVMLRYQEGGARDMSFGTDGLVWGPVGWVPDQLTVSADGDILLGKEGEIRRYAPTGEVDSTWGSGGAASVGGSGFHWSLQNDGLIVGAGTVDSGYPTYSDLCLVRLDAAGVADVGFADEGRRVVDMGGADDAAAVAVTPDGRFVVAGSVVKTAGSAVSPQAQGSSGATSRGAGETQMGLIAAFLGGDRTVISGFSPASGAVGSTVTLAGAGLSDCSAVRFNDVLTTFSVASSRRVVATVPAGATSGKISVTTPGGTVESSTVFTVMQAVSAPTLARLSPTSGRRGITVTLTGKNFGAKRGTSYVKFGATKAGKYVSWSSTRVKVRVPAKAKFGRLKVVVVTSGGASNAKAFTVRR